MNENKITSLFDELLKELIGYDHLEENDICIADLRDEVIRLSNWWDKFRGET